MTFTLNEEAAECGLTGACSVSASLPKGKVSLQVHGNNAGSEPWRNLRTSMEENGLKPSYLPVMSPAIFFTRAADETPSLDVSKLSVSITKYLKVTMTLREPVGSGGGGGGAPPAALQPKNEY